MNNEAEKDKPATDEAVTLIVSTAGLPTPEQIEAMLRGMLTGPIADMVRAGKEPVSVDWTQHQKRRAGERGHKP